MRSPSVRRHPPHASLLPPPPEPLYLSTPVPRLSPHHRPRRHHLPDRVSDYYEVLELADRCCAFLAKRTTADNCCSLLAAAEAASCLPPRRTSCPPHLAPLLLTPLAPSPRPPQASCDKLSAHCYEELKRQFEQASTRPPLHLAFTSP